MHFSWDRKELHQSINIIIQIITIFLLTQIHEGHCKINCLFTFISYCEISNRKICFLERLNIFEQFTQKKFLKVKFKKREKKATFSEKNIALRADATVIAL